MRDILFIILLFFALGCENSVKQENANKFILEDMDTSALIQELNIAEKKKDSISLNEGLDTIVLEYQAFACDCPSWRVTSDSIDSEVFLDIHYYIEPSATDLELPWRIEVVGNKVVFIGKEHEALGYPNKAQFIDLNPPKGRVFRYYSYEVLKPYKVWAASKFDQIDPISGDSMFEPIQIEVK